MASQLTVSTGGHTETYTDPATGIKDNYGVVVFHDLPIVHEYFARLKVPLGTANLAPPGPVTNLFVNLRTGKSFPHFIPPNPSDALAEYGRQLLKYPFVEEGFDLPDPVPKDLLLPYHAFMTKYHLEDALPFLFGFQQGLGDILNIPTLYMFKNLGIDLIRILQGTKVFLNAAGGDNSALYQNATVELGSSVLLNSQVVAVERSQRSGVELVVKTPSGKKLIRAKKVLVTIPPTLTNLHPFNLDDQEQQIFGTFIQRYYYTAVIRNSGIPGNTAISNIGNDSPYRVPTLPAIYDISPAKIPGHHDVKFISTTLLSSEQVKREIVAAVKRLPLNTTTPEFAVFSAHVPFELTVPANAIKRGFYRRLDGLQGKKHTFFTGAAFHTHDSSLLWQLTEKTLNRLLKDLK